MIISRTPFRISFFGGGTDYEPWFREHGGAVLSTTIDKYCYLNCRFLPPFFEHRSRIVWSEIEKIDDRREIRHPVIRAVLELLKIDDGVEIHHHADLPARSGLGSSSSFTNGMLLAAHALTGRMICKREMAEQAIHVEREMLAENVGVQDQIATAHGGLNKILIERDGSFTVEPVIAPRPRIRQFHEQLMLFFTGVSRNASDIAGEQIASIAKKQVELHAMRQLVDEGERILTGGGDLSAFGRLLHETWQLKRGLSARIAPDFVDDVYKKARGAGAVGGKLLGAGGGGFMLFFVPPERKPDVLEALEELIHVPFGFESGGAQLIYYDAPSEKPAKRTSKKTRRVDQYCAEVKPLGAGSIT
jgi:D-glycero-alpha-D-manno-heptose-7-phosphate kinase